MLILLLLSVTLCATIALNDNSTDNAVDLEDGFRSDYRLVPEVNMRFKLHRVQANWREARLRCQMEGATLASPINNQVRHLMQATMRKNVLDELYTGIHDTYSKGDYITVEGIPISRISSAWANKKIRDNDCLRMTSNGVIQDVSCNDLYSYICYRSNKLPNNMTTCGTVDTEYQYNNAEVLPKCYKFHYIARTWSRAHMTCAAEGGHLAIINSQSEALFIKELINKYSTSIIYSNIPELVYAAFVGVRDLDEDGVWYTIHGESLKDAGYEVWTEGHPYNITRPDLKLTYSKSCGAINRKTGTLIDMWCNENVGFVCEKDPFTLTKLDKQHSGIHLE